jgi:hypothetical protein
MPDDPTDPTPDPSPEPEPDKDWKAEAAKWKALARKHEDQAKANADAAKRLKELEDADKTEIQKLSDLAAEAQKRADMAEAQLLRIQVAMAKGLTEAQAKRLVGTTREELEADADELIASFKPADAGNPKADPGPGDRPKERLAGGGDPTAEPDVDVRKIVADIPRGF